MTLRIYSGIRWDNGATTVHVQKGGLPRALRPTRGHLQHLPARFDWGKVSPASLNLAHSLLRSTSGPFLADAYYEAVCDLWIRHWGAKCWVFAHDEVCDVVTQVCCAVPPARYERTRHRRPLCMERWCLNG